ncbi:Abi family protein [Sutcliffiella sp. NC1]|uniref:Abi family protein n=1 Tax=Sutcliffiella sp. NC1 TaxID=3004096 RepID=UPI0022DDBF48|nr:Abi family protein [Sutcliffiella sp. NC1]WBL15118.1 Abi family protein [Sutcliffiella sp. NC1]
MQKLMDNKVLEKLSLDFKEQAKTTLNSLDSNLHKKVINKEKLSIDEQLTYMKAKGINFNRVCEQEAKVFLAENSYYYKITAYRRNFLKDTNGSYIDLDFANLKDLSIIDMHLRYLVLKLSLDIEHSLKTLVINLITDDPGEDGYKIIEDYNDHEFERFKKSGKELNEYKHIRDKILIEVRNKRDYNYDFYIKSKDKISIWKLIEIMTYGHLSSFIQFYVDTNRHKSKQLKKAAQFTPFSKNIRDSAAHSRPILLNVTEENQFKIVDKFSKQKRSKQNSAKASLELKNYIIDKGLDKKVAARVLTNFKVHDLCALLLLHDSYIRGKYMRKSRKNELIKIYRRALYKKSLYKDERFNDVLMLFYKIIKRYKINC